MTFVGCRLKKATPEIAGIVNLMFRELDGKI
jgi:hypothetical protein